MANRKQSSNVRSKNDRVSWMAMGVVFLAVIVLVILVVTAIPKQTAAPAEVSAPQATLKQYDAAPEMSIDVNKQYFATFTMENGGVFKVQLYPDKAPITVNNFVFLARDGYYDGTTFHRVLEGFMAQGGDPTGTGMGDPGYEFVNEYSDLTFDKPGMVAMANRGPNKNSCQWFITEAPQPHLNGKMTIFGELVDGMEVVKKIARVPTTGEWNKPVTPVKLKKLDIIRVN